MALVVCVGEDVAVAEEEDFGWAGRSAAFVGVGEVAVVGGVGAGVE